MLRWDNNWYVWKRPDYSTVSITKKDQNLYSQKDQKELNRKRLKNNT